MRAWTIVFATVLLLSCTRTVYVPVTQHRNVYTTVRDTIVVFSDQGDTVECVTPDTVSRIVCKGAESEARIVEGVLHHRLAVYGRSDSVRVQVRERIVIDSVPYPVYVDGSRKPSIPERIWRFVAVVAIVVAGCCLLLIFRR